jgi:uncharacterized membrane protein
MSAGARAKAREQTIVAQIFRRDPFLGSQLLAALAILIDFALPQRISVGLGPSWLLPALEALVVLALLAVSPHPRVRHSPLRRRISIGLIAVVSAFNIVSLVRLCDYLVSGGRAGGRALIGSGMLLWLTNVLLFALWYWQLDRGGPVARTTGEELLPDFLFVQMTDERYASPDWRPGMIDYLYTSFTNATAFSPTDTMPLTPIAKLLMSAQALTALITVGLVVARAVNILQ